MFRSTKGRVCGWLIYGSRGAWSQDVSWTGKCVPTHWDGILASSSKQWWSEHAEHNLTHASSPGQTQAAACVSSVNVNTNSSPGNVCLMQWVRGPERQLSGVPRHARGPWVSSCFCPFLGAYCFWWPWAQCFIAHSLSFLLCKMGISIAPAS